VPWPVQKTYLKFARESGGTLPLEVQPFFVQYTVVL
jgi:hypothetical protein